MASPDFESQLPEALKALKQPLALVGLAFLFIAITAFMSFRVGKVTGEDIGILLSKINGDLEVIQQSGVKIYNGITHDFFTLDKTIQTLDMVGPKHNLKVKTIDGSDVFVDLKVQYQMIPEMAETVLLASGPGIAFKSKWAFDYVRSICRNYLGELTTEEFYDATKRDVKIINAKKEANRRLNDFGIRIDSLVISQRPRFHEDYEAKIKSKKLADQEIQEERSKANAATQKQYTLIVTETNLKNVAIERFAGVMDQKIIEAKANSEKIHKEAEAYFEKKNIDSEALLYKLKKQSTAILAAKRAEAEGIEALKKALEGKGGVNMVKMEYAKKLKQMQISGSPFTYNAQTNRFQHSADNPVLPLTPTPAKAK